LLQHFVRSVAFFAVLTTLAQEALKRYTSRDTMGVMQPKILLRFPGTCNVHYFQTKLILTSLRPFLITYTTKPYVRSETYIAYKFYALYPKKGILEGNFCLCVENVMRVLDPLFLHIKSWCRKTLNILGFGGHNWKNTFCT